MVQINIPMPHCCVLCPFSKFSGANVVCTYGFSRIVGAYEEAEKQRAGWCPLLGSVAPEWRQGKAYCGNCGKRIPLKIGARFCHKCGREIDWKKKSISVLL